MVALVKHKSRNLDLEKLYSKKSPNLKRLFTGDLPSYGAEESSNLSRPGSWLPIASTLRIYKSSTDYGI